MNVSLPKTLVNVLKNRVPKRQISAFLAEAAEEKFARIESDKAFQELLGAPPTFTYVKDSVRYIQKQRNLDKKRPKQLKS